MPWRDYDPRPYLMRAGFEPERTAPLRANDICFMRRQHRCDKVFGASKSCFVACPTDDALERYSRSLRRSLLLTVLRQSSL